MKTTILALMLALAPACGVVAQKITLGSCTTRDGGQYKGEMVAGKPHGKGNVLSNYALYESAYKDKDIVGFRVVCEVPDSLENE